MYYCEPCRVEHDWPGVITTSFGKCEMCQEIEPCYNFPSHMLSDNNPSRDRDWQTVQGHPVVTYVTEINDLADKTEIVGVSSEWNTAVKRLMEHHPGHSQYDAKEKLTSDLWVIKLNGRRIGYITKMELDKPLS